MLKKIIPLFCLTLFTSLQAVQPILNIDFDKELKDRSGKNQAQATGTAIQYLFDSTRKSKVAVFDGKNGFTLPSLKKLGLSDSDFTICFWFKSSSKEKYPVFISDKSWTWKERGFLIGLRSGKPLVTFFDSKLSLKSWQDSGDLSDGKWHHLTVAYEKGKQLHVHLDGQIVSESELASKNLFASGNTLHFMQDSKGRYPMAASMDDLRIYSSALTEKEIVAINGIKPRVAIFDKNAAWPTYMYSNDRLGFTPDKLKLPLKSN